MIKIENKILIYFTFYINNISFLRNEKLHNQVPINKEEEQIEENNNKEINSEQKNENKKYKLFFNKIKKLIKNNIWFLFGFIFSGMSFLFILFCAIYKIYKRKNKEIIKKKIEEDIVETIEEKKIKLIKNLIKESDTYITIYINNNSLDTPLEIPCPIFCQYIKIIESKKKIFLENFDKLSIKNNFIFSSISYDMIDTILELISDLSFENFSNILNEFKKTKKRMLNLNFYYNYNYDKISKFNSFYFGDLYKEYKDNLTISFNVIESKKEEEILNEILADYCEKKTS